MITINVTTALWTIISSIVFGISLGMILWNYLSGKVENES